MANAQLGVQINRRDGQSQREVGLKELRLVVIVKRIAGERPASLQRLIVTELKEAPFFRIDLCVRRRRTAQTNHKDEPGPVASPIHAVVVTQSLPVRQADLSEARGNPELRTLNIEHPTSNIEHPTLNIEHPTRKMEEPVRVASGGRNSLTAKNRRCRGAGVGVRP